MSATGRLGSLSVELLTDVQTAVRALDVFLGKLDEVKRRQAEALAPPAGGALQVQGLSQLISNVGALTTAVQAAVGVLRQAPAALSPLERELERVATGARQTASDVSQAGAKTKSAFEGFAELGKSAAAAVNAGLKDLGFGITTTLQAVRELDAGLKNLGAGIRERGAATARALQEAFAPLGPLAKETEAFQEKLRAGFQNLFKGVGVGGLKILRDELKQFAPAFDGFAELGRAAAASVGASFAQIGEGITATLQAVREIDAGFKNLGAGIKERGAAAARALQEMLAPLGAFAKETASAQEKLRTGFDNLFRGVAAGGFKAVRAGIDSTTESLSGLSRQLKGSGDDTEAFLTRLKRISGLEGGLRGLLTGFADLIIIQARWLIGFQAINAVTGSIRSLTTANLELDDAMAKVAAISGASASQLAALRQVALDVGRTTVVSATEAAHALILFAQAGFSAGESQAALKAAVALSVGGMASLEESVQLVTTVIRAWNLANIDANRVANVLLATVNVSKASVEGLNTALGYVAAAAAGANVPLETTAAAIGALADQGVKESTQGTALRQVISSLINPSERATAVFQRLGLSLTDLNPLTNDFVEVLKRLRDAGFGAQEAVEAFGARTGAGVVALVRNAESVEYLRTRITGTQAAFEAQARAQESLTAQLTILGNRFKAAAAVMGEDFLPVAKSVVRELNNVLDAFAKFRPLLEGFTLAALIGAFTNALPLPGLLAAGIAGLKGGIVALGTTAFEFATGPMGLIAAALAGLFLLWERSAAAARDFAQRTQIVSDATIRQADGLEKLLAQYDSAKTRLEHAAAGTTEYTVALRDLHRITVVLASVFPELQEQIDKTTGVLTAGTDQVREAIRGRLEATIEGLEQQKAQIAQKINAFQHSFNVNPFRIFDINKLLEDSKAIDAELSKLRDRIAAFDVADKGLLAELPRRIERIQEALQAGDSKEAIRELEQGIHDLAQAGNEEFGPQFSEGVERLKTQLADGTLSVDEFKEVMRAWVPELASLGPVAQATFDQLAEAIIRFAGSAKQGADAADAIRTKLASAADKAQQQADKATTELSGLKAQLSEVEKGVDPAVASVNARIAGAQEVARQKLDRLAADIVAKAKTEAGAALQLEKVRESLAKGTLESSFGPVNGNLANVLREGAALAVKIQSDADKEVTRARISEVGHRLTTEKNALTELERASAEVTAKRLEDEGKYVEAVHAKYAALRADIAKTADSPLTKQRKLDALAAKEEADALEAARKERDLQVQREQALLEVRRQKLEVQHRFELSLLDLERQRLQNGNTFEGQAAGLERIEHRKLELQRQQNAEQIAFAEADRQRAQNELNSEASLSEARRRSLEKTVEAENNRIDDLKNQNALLDEQAKLIHKAGEVAINVGEILKTGIADAFQGIILGTAKLSDVLKNLGTSLLKSITQAFAQSIIEKLHFDQIFKLNFLDLGKFAGTSILSGIGGGLTGALGLLARFVGSAGGLLGRVGSGIGSVLGSVFGGGGAQGQQGANGGQGSGGSGIVSGIGSALGFIGSIFGGGGGSGFGGALGAIGSLASLFGGGGGGASRSSSGQQSGGGLLNFNSIFQILSTLKNAVSVIGKIFPAVGNAIGSVTNPIAGYASSAVSSTGSFLGGLFGAAPTVAVEGGQPVAVNLASQVAKFGFGYTAQQFGTGAAVKGLLGAVGSNLGAVLAIVGSLYSLAQTGKGAADTAHATDKTYGLSGEGGKANLVKGLQAAGLVAGTVGGAAGGAALGAAGGAAIGSIIPGAGTAVGAVVGAIVGAAIGAAIAQAVNAAITGSIGKGVSEAIKKGFKQNQLKDQIRSGLRDNLVLDFLGGPLTYFFTSGLDPISNAILGFLTPDVEKIFDKLFVGVFEKFGVNLNRQLDEAGGGLRKHGKELLKSYKEYGADATAVAQLIDTLTGAGRDNAERLLRHVNILKNSMAQQGKTAEEFKAILDKVFRGVTGSNYVAALRTIEGLFKPPKNAKDTSAIVKAYKREIDELNDTYQQVLGKGVDIKALTDTFISGGFLQGTPKDRKNSRKAVQDAAGTLFEGADFEEGFDKFKAKLGDSMKSAIISGFEQALFVHGPLGVVLVPFFTAIRKLMRQAVHGGGKDGIDGFAAHAAALADKTGAKLSKALTLLAPYLEQVRKIEKQFEDSTKPEFKVDLKQAADAVNALFESDRFDTGFAAFVGKLADMLSKGLEKTLTDALLTSGPIADALQPLMTLIQKGLSDALANGINSQSLSQFIALTQSASANLVGTLSTLKPYLKALFDAVKAAQKALDDAAEAAKSPEEQHNDLLALLKNIRGAISDALTKVNDAFRAMADASARLAQKVFAATHITVKATDTGVEVKDAGTEPNALANAQQEIQRQFSFFDQNQAGLTTQGRISFLQGLESQVDSFFQSTVSAIKERFQPLVEAAARAKKTFEEVRDTIKSLKVSQQSPLSAREKVDLVQRDIQEQQKTLRNTSSDENRLAAAEKLQGLFNQLLDVGGQNFDQSGPEFRAIFKQVLAGLEEVSNITSTGDRDLTKIAADMQEEINAAGERAKSFYDAIQAPLEAALAEQASQAQDQLNQLKAIILGGRDGSIADVMTDLANMTVTQLTDAWKAIQTVTSVGPGAQLPPPPGPPTPPSTLPPPPPSTGPTPAQRADAIGQLRNTLQGEVAWVTSHPAGRGFHAGIVAQIKALVDSVTAPLALLGIDDKALTKKLLNEAKRKNVDGSNAARPAQIKELLDTLLKSIPAAATGGVSMRDTIVRVAEAGSPEAMIPLNQQGIGVFVDVASRIIANSASLNAQLAASVMAARDRASYGTTARSEAAAPTTQQVVLQVQDGAIRIQMPEKVDRAALEALPPRMLELLKRQIRFGELGKVIIDRVG